MKKTLIGAAAVALGVTGALAFVTAAQAEPTTNCRKVTVELTDRNDTGAIDGSVWAKDALTRTLKVCIGDEAEVEGKSTYYANVTDTGTFVTVAGKSPVAGTAILAGIKGTINGGFTVTKFTAPTWDKNFELTAPPTTTSSPNWVSVAFPGSTGANISSYKWTYKSACQKYVDDNGAYTGDITLKCVTTEAPTVTAATCEKAGELKLPMTTGVEYKATEPTNDGKVTVTATATAGYKLVGDKSWDLTIPAKLPADSEQCKAPTTTPTTTPTATPTPTPTKSATVAPVTPSESESTPAQAGLPVTGPGGGTNVPLIGGLAGSALLAFGIALFAWAKRRRDNEVEFTA